MKAPNRKRPKGVEILGQIFKIQFYKEAIYDEDTGEELYADIDFQKFLIRIQDRRCWKEKLLHEVLHGVLTISGFAEMIPGKNEEALVLLLENYLPQIMKLNLRSVNFIY